MHKKAMLYWAICTTIMLTSLSGLQCATSKRLIKLRIGNPTNRGLLVTIIDPLKNNIVKNVQYVPPKGTGYFAGSNDITVDVTHSIGLRITNLASDAPKEQINAEINKVSSYLKDNRLTLIKIGKTDVGLTKAYVTLSVTNLIPTLNPNPKIQGINLHPEIIFTLVRPGILTEDERKNMQNIRICPRFGTCDTTGPDKKSALGSSIKTV